MFDFLQNDRWRIVSTNFQGNYHLYRHPQCSSHWDDFDSNGNVFENKAYIISHQQHEHLCVLHDSDEEGFIIQCKQEQKHDRYRGNYNAATYYLFSIKTKVRSNLNWGEYQCACSPCFIPEQRCLYLAISGHYNLFKVQFGDENIDLSKHLSSLVQKNVWKK